MIIRVTQEHIDKGRRQSRAFCPISLALRDVFGVMCDPRVDKMHIALGPSNLFKIPVVAKAFIDMFDSGSSQVRPFQFKLEPKCLSI